MRAAGGGVWQPDAHRRCGLLHCGLLRPLAASSGGRWRSLATGRTSPLRLIAASCGLLRRQVAEFGDRTQIAIVVLCVDYNPVFIAVGALVAFVFVTAGGGGLLRLIAAYCGLLRPLCGPLRPRRLRLRHRRWGRAPPPRPHCGLLRLIAASFAASFAAHCALAAGVFVAAGGGPPPAAGLRSGTAALTTPHAAFASPMRRT